MKTNFYIIIFLLLPVLLIAQHEAPNETDSDGKKHGEWVVKFPNNFPRYQGQFDHGVPKGTFFYYYETGEKSSQVTHIDSLNSTAVFFHKNGTIMGEGAYYKREKHGEWRFYDNQAILSSIEQYVNGKIEGTVQIYHVNGTLAAEIPYVNGLKNGPFKEYNTDGKVRVEGTYRDNTFDGAYKQYYDDGSLYIEGQYRAAVKDGLWKEYAPDGRLKVQQVYDKGKLINEKIEPGFEKEKIEIDLEEEDIIDEQQLLEQFHNQGPPR